MSTIEKKKNKNNDYRIGRRIFAKKVLVIDQHGKNLGVMHTKDALAKAEESALDLVEINRGEIPTCKILDYGKMKYQESKKEKKKTKKSHEIQFRPKIAEHDLCTKIGHARKFLEKGSIVTLIVQFRGREATHPETGKVILDRAAKDLTDICVIRKFPTMQDKKMSMILLPKSE